MVQAEYVLAVDVSLDHLDVALEAPSGEYLLHHRAFPNNWPGYLELREELLAHLDPTEPARLTVAGESTGDYWWHSFYHISRDPALAAFQPALAVLNPKHVKHFRRALPEQDKDDVLDPQLIARFYHAAGVKSFYTFHERYLPLRQLTRAYSRLIHALAAEKAYALHLVYLLASEYPRVKPFSDFLGVTSRRLLTTTGDFADWLDLSLEELVALVEEGPAHFPDSDQKARQLQCVARNSYPLAETLRLPVQTVLQLTVEHVRFLQSQQQAYQGLIAAELERLPEAQLTLAQPGLGPILVGGCLAEIQDTRRFLSGQKYDRQKKRYRRRTYQDAQAAVGKLAGLWWPYQSSGHFASQDNQLAHERNTYLRFWAVQAAASLKRHQADYRNYYWHKFKESSHHQHKRALILTARKALRLIFALLHKGQQRWLEEEAQRS